MDIIIAYGEPECTDEESSDEALPTTSPQNIPPLDPGTGARAHESGDDEGLALYPKPTPAYDYLGLNGDDRDDDTDSDNVEEPVAIKQQKRRAVSARDVKISKLIKREEEYPDLTPVTTRCEATQKNGQSAPQSSFWTKEQRDDFLNPVKVWGVDSETDQNTSVMAAHPRAANFGTGKRQCAQGVMSTHPTNAHPLKKTCFFVHHRIGPSYSASSISTCAIPNKQFHHISAHNSTVSQIKWSSPQYSHLLLSVSLDSSVRIWNVFSKSNPCIQTFSNHKKGVKQGTWSNCGMKILTASYDKTARLFDVEKGVQVQQYSQENFVTCVVYHPVHLHSFISGSRNCLSTYDTRASPKPVKTYRHKESFGQVQDLCILPNGQTMFTCNDMVSRDSADRNIMAWDFASGVVISNQIYQERYSCTRLKLHPNESQLLAQSNGDYVAIFSTIKPFKMDKYKRFEGHKVRGYNVGFDVSPDGRWIASGSSDGSVYYYDYNFGRRISRIPVGGLCMDVAWHPLLSSTVAVACGDGEINIWQ